MDASPGARAMSALHGLPLQHRNTEHGVGRMLNTNHICNPHIHGTASVFSAQAWQSWCFLTQKVHSACDAGPVHKCVVSRGLSDLSCTQRSAQCEQHISETKWTTAILPSGRQPLNILRDNFITKGKQFSVLKHTMALQECSVPLSLYPRHLFSSFFHGSEQMMAF